MIVWHGTVGVTGPGLAMKLAEGGLLSADDIRSALELLPAEPSNEDSETELERNNPELEPDAS